MENNLSYEKVLKKLIGHHNMFSSENDKIVLEITDNFIQVEFIKLRKIVKEIFTDRNIGDTCYERVLISVFNTLIS